MTAKFPLGVDLFDNNCTIFGGGQHAYQYMQKLMSFGAKITVISPDICDEIKKLTEKNRIRYIPRRYFRGDCSTSYLCVAATDDSVVNIAISDECKAKSIAVYVDENEAFGTFSFPEILISDGVSVTIQSDNKKLNDYLLKSLEQLLPVLISRSEIPENAENLNKDVT